MRREGFPHLAYIVAVKWPEGWLFGETYGSRESAQDAVAEAIKNGKKDSEEYAVFRTEFSLNGRPVAVCDVTHSFQIDPPEEAPDVLGNRVDEAWAAAGGYREAAE